MAGQLLSTCRSFKAMARVSNEEQSPEPDTLPDAAEGETGPESAGQSGDTQGLSNLAEANSESVRELVAEGQYFEAAVISGIENAPDADVAEVTTTEVPEDDVPLEYLERDKH
jgi:hypothetical protein